MLPCTDRRKPEKSHGARKRHLYRVYGLVVASEVELPELVPACDQSPEVEICFGDVPATLRNVVNHWSWCIASKNEFLLTIKDVARYHIADGCRITIERRLGLEKGVPPADLRLWLLGSAFGALLHQRGLLPLHVSAVKTPTGVWAFTGESGEGKSTLAGFLHRRYEWDLVSDDVSVVEDVSVGPVIQPGPRKLKLWADALTHLDFKDCQKVRDLSNTEKFQLYLPVDSNYQPEPLHALVILESASDSDTAIVQRLKGAEAFNACLGAVYRPYMEKWFKFPEQRIKELAGLCQRIDVYRFRRPRSLDDFERNLQELVSLMNNNPL